MPKRSIQRGRPTGTTTYEAEPAIAFGAAVREERTNQGIAQETLAHMAGIERSHMGKIERGEHIPRQLIKRAPNVEAPQEEKPTGPRLILPESKEG